MIEKFQHKYALSRQGAMDMVKACFLVALSNIILMMPAGLLYQLIGDLMSSQLDSGKILFYVAGTAIVLALIAVTQKLQYNATFLTTYKESGVRRTTIAETLRKLPLSYFDKRDLSDLTTNIMADCAQIETASSHWIPELIGALISTAIVGISLLAMFDWRLALASFRVIPVAFAVVAMSSKMQKNAVCKNTAVKLELADGIQECLESARDLRANNAQADYMDGLKVKIKNVEQQALATEVKMAVFVSSAQMILKLGIATTALVGGVLFASGEITVLTFFLFLMIVSRLYDPMQIAL